jgi:hypothetical protein
VLWGAITLLATWATTARLRRDRARLAAMEAEDTRDAERETWNEAALNDDETIN